MSTGSMLIIGAGVGAVLGVVVLALQIDDWSRDLTTNVAQTSADAGDSLLRPLTIPHGVPEAAAAVVEAAMALPRWREAGRSDSAGHVELRFVVTTRLFRFKDDVTVWIEPVPEGARIRARSASRVGRGDLGTNPRTLRSLMQAIREQVGPSPN